MDVEKPILKAALILERNVGGKFPGLETLAKHCNISISTLKRSFKAMHGVTPLQYFRTQQVVFIKGMLNGREKTLKELTATFGFTRSSTFTTWYKKLMGELPIKN